MSGCAGGRAATAHYDEVSSGSTGHAESVRVRFDPQQVSYQQFHVAQEYHQNYLALHPYEPCIVFNDLPKLGQLKRQFPELYG